MSEKDLKKPSPIAGYLEDIVAPEAAKSSRPVGSGLKATDDPSYNPTQDKKVKVQENKDSTSTVQQAKRKFGTNNVNAGAPFNPDNKDPDKWITVTGDSRLTGPSLTGAEAETVDNYRELQLQATRKSMEWDLGVSLASQYTSKQAADIADRDHEAMQKLVTEDFSRWRAQNEQFTQQLEEAKKLKVNPYAYMQNAGKGGRAASVVAVGLSQLAAGAGNPNQVLARIKAAVDRDVSAQVANIELAYKGIAAGQNQQDREQFLLESQIGYMDKLRALEYNAILGQLDTVVKSVQSESAYQAIQMLKPRLAAEGAIAAGTTRANATAILVEQAVARAHTALQKKVIAERMFAADKARVRASDMGPGEEFAPLKDLSGNVYGGDPQEVGMGQEQQIPTGTPEQQLPADTQAPMPRAAQRSRRPVQAPPQAAGTQGQATPATGLTGDPQATVEEVPTTEEAPATEEVTNAARGADPDELFNEASNVVAFQRDFEGIERSEQHLDLLVGQVETIINGGQAGAAEGIAIAHTPEDAIVLAAAYPPPNPDNFQMDPQGYQEAMERWRHRKLNTELFEKPVARADGYSNRIPIGNGEYLVIAHDQKTLRNDDTLRNERASQYLTAQRDAEALMEAANDLAVNGSSSLLGLSFTDKGLQWRPANAELAAERAKTLATLQKNSGAIIRQVQGENARMSDQDIKFSDVIGRAILNKMNVTWDFMRRAWATAHPDNPKASKKEMAKAIRSYYANLAVGMQMPDPEGFGIVPSYENLKSQRVTSQNYEKALNNDIELEDGFDPGEVEEDTSILDTVQEKLPFAAKLQLNVIKQAIDAIVD